MNICLLSTSTPLHQVGGTELHAEILARLAAAKGHRVFWVTTASPDGRETEKKDGYRIDYLRGTSHRMSRKDAPAWWSASTEKILALKAEHGLDVIWAENLCGQHYAAFARAKAGVPLVSIINGLGIRGEVISNWNRVNSFSEIAWFFTRYAVQTLFYYLPWLNRTIRDSDLVVAISDESFLELGQEFPSARGKMIKIYNPIDTALFAPDKRKREAARHKLGVLPGEQLLLMTGVLHKQKGFHVGLKAFALLREEFPGLKLAIAGDGPEAGALKTAAERSGLSNAVTFTGNIPNRDLPEIYNAADIYLNPTLRKEGLALVILEAMACGLPSVISKIGGTGSTITDGVNGFFTSPGDSAGIAKKTAAILRDPALAAAMGAAAREKACADFSEKNIGRYLEISEGLLKAGK